MGHFTRRADRKTFAGVLLGLMHLRVDGLPENGWYDFLGGRSQLVTHYFRASIDN